MNKIECSLPELLNVLTIAQSQMKGKGKEWAIVVASSSSQKKPKSRKKKRTILGVMRDIGKTELKAK